MSNSRSVVTLEDGVVQRVHVIRGPDPARVEAKAQQVFRQECRKLHLEPGPGGWEAVYPWKALEREAVLVAIVDAVEVEAT